MKYCKLTYENGFFDCDLAISKKQWLEVLKDRDCRKEWHSELRTFINEPDRVPLVIESDKDLGIHFRALNSQIMWFGQFVSEKLDIKVVDSGTGEYRYWPFTLCQGPEKLKLVFRQELVDALAELDPTP